MLLCMAKYCSKDYPDVSDFIGFALDISTKNLSKPFIDYCEKIYNKCIDMISY